MYMYVLLLHIVGLGANILIPDIAGEGEYSKRFIFDLNDINFNRVCFSLLIKFCFVDYYSNNSGLHRDDSSQLKLNNKTKITMP